MPSEIEWNDTRTWQHVYLISFMGSYKHRRSCPWGCGCGIGGRPLDQAEGPLLRPLHSAIDIEHPQCSPGTAGSRSLRAPKPLRGKLHKLQELKDAYYILKSPGWLTPTELDIDCTEQAAGSRWQLLINSVLVPAKVVLDRRTYVVRCSCRPAALEHCSIVAVS